MARVGPHRHTKNGPPITQPRVLVRSQIFQVKRQILSRCPQNVHNLSLPSFIATKSDTTNSGQSNYECFSQHMSILHFIILGINFILKQRKTWP